MSCIIFQLHLEEFTGVSLDLHTCMILPSDKVGKCRSSPNNMHQTEPQSPSPVLIHRRRHLLPRHWLTELLPSPRHGARRRYHQLLVPSPSVTVTASYRCSHRHVDIRLPHNTRKRRVSCGLLATEPANRTDSQISSHRGYKLGGYVGTSAGISTLLPFDANSLGIPC